MQGRQGNTLQALRGVRAFLDMHAGKLGALAASGVRRKFDAQLEALDVHAAIQSGSDLVAQGATRNLYALRRVLVREHMLPIARIAAAELTWTPAFLALKMPKSNANTELLYAAAQGMAKAVGPHAAVFIDALLPPDFIARLRAAADAMRVPLDARRKSRGARHGATEGLKLTLQSALKTVRVLDASVRIALKDNPALLANWDVVKRPPVKAVKAVAAVQTPVQAHVQAHVQAAVWAQPVAMVRSGPVVQQVVALPERVASFQSPRTWRLPWRLGRSLRPRHGVARSRAGVLHDGQEV